MHNRCPICSGVPSREYNPFCSKRCADIDLYRWITGVYGMDLGPVADEVSVPELASDFRPPNRTPSSAERDP